MYGNCCPILERVKRERESCELDILMSKPLKNDMKMMQNMDKTRIIANLYMGCRSESTKLGMANFVPNQNSSNRQNDFDILQQPLN